MLAVKSTIVQGFTFAVLFLLSALSAHASDESAKVRAVVEANVANVLAEYERAKPSFEQDPDGFFKTMDAALSEIVDFKRIAARVMGKYARKASKAQRGQFTQVFKSTLFDTYSRALVDSGSFEIKVTKAAINSRSDKRATVDMEVISQTGNVYPVSYSMFKNKSGEWLMENVVVFGVNMGLAFRDKFASEYRSKKGDIDAVIAAWSVDLEINVPKPEPKPKASTLASGA